MTKHKRRLKRILLGFALLSAGCFVLARLAGTVFLAFADTNSRLATVEEESAAVSVDTDVIRIIKEN